MVRDELDEELFEIELEKMVAKNKYDDLFAERKDDCSTTETSENLASSSQAKQTADASKIHFDSSLEGNSNGKSLNVLWEENCGRMIYNIETKSFDFGNQQATTYKHNRDIFMPPPQSSDKETCHEIRRNEMRRIFKRAQNKQHHTNKGTSMGVATKSPGIASEVSGNSSNSKKYKFYDKGHKVNVDSNLSPDEIDGLRSLKKRISDGSLIVCETDKSKRFALMTKEQYLRAGFEHTKNDIELEPHLVKKSKIV